MDNNTPFELILGKLHKKQKEVHSGLKNNQYNHIILVAGRQSGKTYLGVNYLLEFTLNTPNTISMVVSPTENQVIKIYQDIIDNTDAHPSIIKSHKRGKGDGEIRLQNGSTILFRSAKSGDSLRGYTVTGLLWLDEFRDFNRVTVETVLKPMLIAGGKRKKVFVTSTPAGKNNILYQWFTYGLSKDSRFSKWQSYHFTCFDTPRANFEELEFERQTIPELVWRQEYLGEFVDAGCLFNNVGELMVLDELNEPIEDEIYYAGLDIGLVSDASVLSILDKNGHLVKYYRYDGIETPVLINQVLEVNEKWRFKKLLVENNGLGRPIADLLRMKLSGTVAEFNTTGKNKPELINQLIMAFRMRTIQLVKSEELRDELESFIGVPMGSYMKYEARAGSHDDMVMSLAIARYCWEMFKYNSSYTNFFK